MKLSILIPTIPSRLGSLTDLLEWIEAQATDEVEILYLGDNKKRSIGKKREALVRLAQGDYMAFIDDDDYCDHLYCHRALKAIDEANGADVITFNQKAAINGEDFIVKFQFGAKNEPAEKDEDGKYKDLVRPPWHICLWRRDLVQDIDFPDLGYGEDWAFAKEANKRAKTSYHIEGRQMHYYVYDDDVTEAPTDEKYEG